MKTQSLSHMHPRSASEMLILNVFRAFDNLPVPKLIALCQKWFLKQILRKIKAKRLVSTALRDVRGRKKYLGALAKKAVDEIKIYFSALLICDGAYVSLRPHVQETFHLCDAILPYISFRNVRV